MNLSKKEKIFLTLIILLTIIFNLYFAITTNYFTQDTSYFHIRQAEYITQNIKPLTNDLLTQGNNIYYQPLFHYLLALFSLIPLGLKIFSVLSIALIPLMIYLLSKEITNNTTISLLTALMSAFLPILLHQTLNQITPYTLAIPLILYLLYSLLHIEQKLNHFITASFLLVLIHPSALILTFTLIFYLLFMYTENIEISKLKKEAIGFFIFLSLLATFIIFKKPLIDLGLNLLTQNTPKAIPYFTQLKLTIYQLSFLPLIFGTIGIFTSIKSKKEIFFITNSFLLSILILMIFKLIPFTTGLLFLALTLTILSSQGIKKTYTYVEKTKLAKSKHYLTLLFLILITITLIIPSYQNSHNLIEENTITDEEFQTLGWIKESTKPNALILASPIEGHYITGIADRKNLIHSNYISIKNSDQIYSDVKEIYTTPLETVALENLRKHDVDFFYISERGKEFYKIDQVNHIENDECFQKRYNTTRTEVFKIIC